VLATTSHSARRVFRWTGTWFATPVTKRLVQFRILGPLEVVVGGEALELGGAKQRTVLAVLLLRAGEVVSVERLVDELWGDDPPPSASHSLEVYVSRIRRVLPADDAALSRRGSGYCLEMAEDAIDAHVFEQLHQEASAALGRENLERAAAVAERALGLWRGPALAGLRLGRGGEAERELLDESRLAVAELLHDAQLAQGRYEEAVAPLQALVAEHPFREGLVQRLMVALYGSGRQAEALETYERTRRLLRDELGLQPSAGLQQLSGEIVRQDLELPSRGRSRDREKVDARPKPPRRLSRLLVLAAGAVSVALAAGGSAPQTLPATAGPVQTPSQKRALSFTLVLPRVNDDAQDNRRLSQSFAYLVDKWGASGVVLRIEPSDPAEVTRLADRIRADGVDYVIAVGEQVSHALVPAVGSTLGTRFAFVDASLADLGLAGARNAIGLRFEEEHTAELMGYLGALMHPRRTGRGRVDVVSLVAGPLSPEVGRLVAGFKRGAHGASRAVKVRVDHVPSTSDPTACERAANEQIDAGSEVVYVDAGPCGLGALAVARTRGVWAIAAGEDGPPAGPHLLATTYKDWEWVIRLAVSQAEMGTYSPGRDQSLGLDDDYAVGVDVPSVEGGVTEALWSRVVERCSKIRQRAREADARTA